MNQEDRDQLTHFWKVCIGRLPQVYATRDNSIIMEHRSYQFTEGSNTATRWNNMHDMQLMHAVEARMLILSEIVYGILPLLPQDKSDILFDQLMKAKESVYFTRPKST